MERGRIISSGECISAEHGAEPQPLLAMRASELQLQCERERLVRDWHFRFGSFFSPPLDRTPRGFYSLPPSAPPMGTPSISEVEGSLQRGLFHFPHVSRFRGVELATQISARRLPI
eukprot:scaffold194561_cov34-Tisochrysis_lutea.AAC.1